MMAPRAMGTQERYGRQKRYREDIPAPIDDTSKHIPLCSRGVRTVPAFPSIWTRASSRHCPLAPVRCDARDDDSPSFPRKEEKCVAGCRPPHGVAGSSHHRHERHSGQVRGDGAWVAIPTSLGPESGRVGPRHGGCSTPVVTTLVTGQSPKQHVGAPLRAMATIVPDSHQCFFGWDCRSTEWVP
jgi:hypothetical protein